MTEVDTLLYREALLDLLRTTHSFASAILIAGDRARHVDPAAADDALATRVLDECRAAVLGAIAAVPGMVQLFAAPGSDLEE